MDSMKKRIAVIGAGISGINSIVSLKEIGYEPVCFEYTDKPGGTWCYRKKSVNGVASIMPTTVINNSKEIGAFSTYPPRKEYSNYMRHHELYEYAMDYAAEKDAFRHIQCNSEVICLKRSDDYKETGRWSVTVKNTLTGELTSETFDGVLVCVGHMNRPKMPTYAGQESFKGKIMHTHTLKEVEKFKDKNVVVVGMGCSGMDAAVETSSVAKQVYLSTRSGAHVMNRVGNNGHPFDTTAINRYSAVIMNLSWPIASWLLETLYLDSRFDPSLYTVPPTGRALSKDPALNDQISSKILSGSVIQKKAIERFTEEGVVFQGDTDQTLADVVIMATGYTWKFPFLEEGIITHGDGIVNLYKCMFPPQLPHSTIAFIGFVLPWGPGFPVIELQTRYAASVLSGKTKLPSQREMYQEIKQRQDKNLPRYGPSEKTSLRVDFIHYMDDIASQFGAKPNFLVMFFTDIRLFMKLWFGHFVSYQYRLQGPNAWKEAREAIMTSEDRIFYPLKKYNKSTQGFVMNFIKRILRFLFAR